VAVCLGLVGPEEAFIALQRHPSASIDIRGLSLMDIARDLRCDRKAIREQASKGGPGKEVANGLAQRDPPLAPVDLA
jgi:hypothetical protein